jgi:gamma-glutamyltranspeptidase/glutathione hydrolase
LRHGRGRTELSPPSEPAMLFRLFSTFFTLLLSCHSIADTTEKQPGSGAVASPDQYGAAVAEQILRRGGNAVDAAIATAFTLAVTYPEAGNIGGGGFMTLWFDGKPTFWIIEKPRPQRHTAICIWTQKNKSLKI